MKHMEQIRRVLLYETFIAHYIEMAKALLKFQSWNQILIYLKQASRLCDLLIEDGRESEAQNYMSKIDTIHRDVMTERNRDPKSIRPQLPFRQNSTDNIQLKSALTEKSINVIEKMSPISSGKKFEHRQVDESDSDSEDMHNTVIRSECVTNVQIHINDHRNSTDVDLKKRNIDLSSLKSKILNENCTESDIEDTTEL